MKMKGSMVMDKLDKIYEICAEHFKEMPCSIQYVPIKYLNEELCIAALANSKRTEWEEREIWKYIPDNMLTYNVCLAAADSNRYALEHIPNVHKTADIYLRAVKKCGKLLQYVPVDYHTEDMYIYSVSQDGSNLRYVPQSSRTEKVCMAAFNAQSKGSAAVEYIPDKFLTEEMCRQAVTLNWETIKVIPNHFKSTEVWLCALKHSKWAEINEKQNKPLIQYVRANASECIADEICQKFSDYLEQKRREEDEYRKWIQLVSANPFCLKDIPKEKRDYKLCKIAIENEGLMLKYVPEDHRIKWLCDIAVRNNPDAIAYVPEEIQTDVIELVKNSYQYIRILFSDSKFKDCFFRER